MSKASYKIFSLRNKKAFDIANQDALVLKSRFGLIIAKKITEELLPSLINLPEEVVRRRGLTKSIRFIGMKASKKLGGAVERNFVKRRIRAIFYEYCKNNIDITESISVIVIPNKYYLSQQYSEISSNFHYLLKKIL